MLSRFKDLSPTLRRDAGISVCFFVDFNSFARTIALGGQFWLRAQSQTSFADHRKMGWLQQLWSYFRAAEMLVWSPAPPTLPQIDQLRGNRWPPPGLLADCPLAANCYCCHHSCHCWRSRSGGSLRCCVVGDH